MSNRKQYHATLLTADSQYELNQEVAESFNGFDITVGPKTATEEMGEVVGIVEDCWYNDDIVAKISIFDEAIEELLDEGEASVCPSIVRKLGEDESIEGMDVFVTRHPGEMVGGVEEV
jgi:hypothetical protein